MWGFETLKDVLNVIIVPIVLFALGALLPRWLEARKRKKFSLLIKRELREMTPVPSKKIKDGKWWDHLKKRFIDEQIFRNPSGNRDFILTLPSDLAYCEAQLWIHYKKARRAENSGERAEHGASWCEYLDSVCKFFDRHGSKKLP